MKIKNGTLNCAVKVSAEKGHVASLSSQGPKSSLKLQDYLRLYHSSGNQVILSTWQSTYQLIPFPVLWQTEIYVQSLQFQITQELTKLG